MTDRPEWRLYLNNRFTGICVRPDEKYPKVMWRVHNEDGVSDMVNLTRAKDAALTWGVRKMRPGSVGGLRPGDVVRWEYRGDNLAEAG